MIEDAILIKIERRIQISHFKGFKVTGSQKSQMEILLPVLLERILVVTTPHI